MQMPAESAGSDTLIDLGVYTLAALGADPSAATIKGGLDAKQGALAAAAAGRIASEQAITAATALASAAEVDVELTIRRIESRALELVKKQRALDPYARLFPGNLEAALRPVGRLQAAEALRISDLLAPASGLRLAAITDELASLGVDLRARASALLDRITGVEAAETAATAAYGAELSARRAWREQYRKSHAQLTDLYPSDKRKVESFFRASKKGAKKPGAPPPAPAAG